MAHLRLLAGRTWLHLTCAFIPLFGVGGCVSINHSPQEQGPALRFDAIAFFSGRTEGKGVLKVAMHHAALTFVEGEGRVSADGSIVLDQTVRRGQRPPTHREWLLRRESPARYVGTLSDAAGPVTGTVEGNRLHIAFATKSGLKVNQWMYLLPGGSTAQNVMIVRKFGVPVARLDEIIARVPG